MRQHQFNLLHSALERGLCVNPGDRRRLLSAETTQPDATLPLCIDKWGKMVKTLGLSINSRRRVQLAAASFSRQTSWATGHLPNSRSSSQKSSPPLRRPVLRSLCEAP
jgi:hypothetical protein